MASTSDHPVIFKPDGPTLDANAAAKFQHDFESMLTMRINVLLDFSDVEFLDSAGLSSIVNALRKIDEFDGTIKICGVQDTVRTLFDVVRLQRLVDIYTSRDEAMASI